MLGKKIGKRKDSRTETIVPKTWKSWDMLHVNKMQLTSPHLADFQKLTVILVNLESLFCIPFCESNTQSILESSSCSGYGL